MPELNLLWCACLSDASKAKGKWSVVRKGSVSESGEVMFVPPQPCDGTSNSMRTDSAAQGRLTKDRVVMMMRIKSGIATGPPYQVPFLFFAGRLT